MLSEPLTVGALDLPHRVWMAPLTRMRATAPADLPNDAMLRYYVQRAGAAMIVSEGTQVSPEGKGYMDTPGIHSAEQVRGWRRITDAVHEAGGTIAAQLWHVGRVSHASFHGGQAPVSASASPFRNRTTIRGDDGQPVRVPCPTPRALALEEIPRLVDDFRRATANARTAGFDAVEVHAAHGYLLHQFLSTESNTRDDAYGGTIDNRARLVLEIVDAVCEAWEPDRVGVRISPVGRINGLDDPAGADTGLHVAAELVRRGLAYLHLSEPDWTGAALLPDGLRRELRSVYPGVIVAAGGYTVQKAVPLIREGLIDAVAFGRAFIANPDLPQRLARDLPLNEPVPETFYGGSEIGYTDYPSFT
ncbi:N-ethylmaleimide reductase [Aeromicrobium sp. CFBP 8757]|nr:N-ethylmaleimide reductase [Aeromicrobium sp. CFBP 8757]